MDRYRIESDHINSARNFGYCTITTLMILLIKRRTGSLAVLGLGLHNTHNCGGWGAELPRDFKWVGIIFEYILYKKFCHYNSAVLLRSAARDILQSVNVALRIGLNGLMMMITTSCRRAAATICPTPLPLWTPKCLAPPSTPQLAVVSHAEYVPTLTAAPALRVKAALSKAAWWPLTF